MEPSLIIIGGGVAGLTAGCYARMNGKITVHNKFYDPHAAPKGKSAITVF
ncbi:hypothetical protein [Desulfosporosinus sp.]|nr:hypothetical protein [Desulfosporosinus sp.]MBC2723946.1 hypothetical protein [Desulfosporosinus sp.]MBC2728382.1 hypothetical protein [Desulfosporosinus sp.]